MPSARLDPARINALKPRTAAYELRDTDLKAFGIQILPSGRVRYFIHVQHQGRRLWKTLDAAEAMNADEARSRATALRAAFRQGEDVPVLPEDTLFEAVAEEVFHRYARHWKPRTLEVNRGYYRKQILPWFRGRPIADITRNDVQDWFASLHATPVAADRSAPVLSVILRQAELYGYRPEDSNPCKGIKRYRRQERERFLSPREIRRLAAVLAHQESARPLQVALIRLLLLTGCRKSELLTLEWTCYREGNLFLRDSKTGPRTVWLSSAAREVLDSLPRRTRWVFPSARADRPEPLHAIDGFWSRIRAEADLRDVRLHDLRHTYASQALLRGVPLPVVARLLGHKQPRMTLRYAHVGDREIESAAERIGEVMMALMNAAPARSTSVTLQSVVSRQVV